MENATKAFYMAAGMLIAILILSVWVYMFRVAGTTSESYEIQEATEQLQLFNSKFENYSISTLQAGNSDHYKFYDKGNNISEVISCANLAYSINEQNDYDLTNSVIVEVRVTAGSNPGVYYIVPDEGLSKGTFKKLANNTANKGLGYENISTIMAGSDVSFSDLQKEFNEMRVVTIQDSGVTDETVYRYYFDVDADSLKYSESSGKVNKIIFTLYETKNYNDTTYWIGN